MNNVKSDIKKIIYEEFKNLLINIEGDFKKII